MSKTSKRGPVAPRCNLTPMIDVIFQLLIFFLIISRIVSEEAIKLAVPHVDKSQVVRIERDNSLIINFYHSNYLRNDAKAVGERQANRSAVESVVGSDGNIDSVKASRLGEYGGSEYIGSNGNYNGVSTGTNIGLALIEFRKHMKAMIFKLFYVLTCLPIIAILPPCLDY